MDAEAIGMIKRLLGGMKVQTETLATAMFEGINFKGDFLKQKITRSCSQEQYLPSPVIDRASVRAWQESGSLDAFGRAKIRVNELLGAYQRPKLAPEIGQELVVLMKRKLLAAGNGDVAGSVSSTNKTSGDAQASPLV